VVNIDKTPVAFRPAYAQGPPAQDGEDALLILVVGPSGAGKDTLLNGVRDELDEHSGIRFVRRVITRPGDLGEEEHESATEQEFLLRAEAGDFALSWQAHGLHYGIPADIAFDLAKGKVVVANVSRAVVAEAAAKFPVAVIEVTAPSKLLAQRLEQRGRETADDVARRLARDIELPLPVTRLVVVNDGTKQEGVRRLLACIREAAGLDIVQG
jgi:ribose 1,5-bisphosphokinase